MEQMIIPQNVLAQIFHEQNQLLKKYIIIEDLPTPPINLNLKKNQSLIREFLGRFTNEMAEAFDCLVEAFSHMNTNKREHAIMDCESYNEELADAVHFLIEMLIYCGISAEGLEMNFKNFIESKDLKMEYNENRPLKDMFEYNLFVNGMDIKQWIYATDSFRIFPIDERFDLGVRNISWPILEEHAKNMFIVIYEFNKAVNLLKNKNWNQTDRSLNMIAFHEALLKGFMSFVYYLELAGIGESALYINYMQKNKKNYERLNNEY